MRGTTQALHQSALHIVCSLLSVDHNGNPHRCKISACLHVKQVRPGCLALACSLARVGCRLPALQLFCTVQHL